MSGSPTRGWRALRLAPLAAFLLTSCGTRAILGPREAPTVLDDAGPDAVIVDGNTARDAPDAVVVPDVVVRDVTLRDVALPDATLPDVTLPDVTLPDATLPDVTLPDVTLPDASLVDVLRADAPDAPDARDAVPADVPDVADATADAGPPVPGILGAAARFTILAGSTVSNAGISRIVGEVGVSPGTALVGIPAGTVVHAGDPTAALAQSDVTVAYNYLAGLPCGTVLTGRDLGGMTLPPGVYCFSSSAQLTGTIFLDGQGRPGPMWIFQIGSTLVTSNAAAVVMLNGARSCGVYWQTGSSATIGIGANFAGNIIAAGSVTLTTGVALSGRALARSGAVTMESNMVSNASCPDPARPAPMDAGTADAGPTDASRDGG